MRRRPRALVLTSVVLAVVVASLASCGSDDRAPVATYEQPGPHAAEQLTMPVDGPAGPDEVRVWAPDPESGEGESGPWPLLVYGHGLGLDAADHDRELAHIASWGFVTAAHEHTKDVDLVDLAGTLYVEADDPASPLHGLIDRDEPLVLGGMSQGTGYAATSASAADDAVAGALFVSGGGAPAAGGAGTVPTLVLGGGRDPSTPAWLEPGFEAAQGPAVLVLVEDAGHLTFSSVCTSADRAEMAGGNPQDCAPPEVGEESLWPAIDHTTVAFLRWVTGQDPSSDALSADVIGSLGARVTVRGDLDRG